MHIQEAPKRPVMCRFGGCFISVFGIVWEPLNYQVTPGALEEVQNDLLRPIRFLKPESYRNFYIDMHIYIYLQRDKLLPNGRKNTYIYIFLFYCYTAYLELPITC